MKAKTKRSILSVLALLTILCCSAWIVFAAGTATVTLAKKWDFGGTKRRAVQIAWVDNAGTTATLNVATLGIDGWMLYSCVGNPGTHALTDNFDMYLYDSDGVDLGNGTMVNSDNSTSMSYRPLNRPVVNGNLTFTLSGNSEASGNGTLTCIFFEK